jgi:hypothetical protein
MDAQAMLTVTCKDDGSFHFEVSTPAAAVDALLGAAGCQLVSLDITAPSKAGALNMFHHLLDPVKVYEITEGEWYMGRSLEEARDAAFSAWGYTTLADAITAGAVYDDDGRELDASDMRRLTFRTDQDAPDMTFADALLWQLSEGNTVPGHFASQDQ